MRFPIYRREALQDYRQTRIAMLSPVPKQRYKPAFKTDAVNYIAQIVAGDEAMIDTCELYFFIQGSSFDMFRRQVYRYIKRAKLKVGFDQITQVSEFEAKNFYEICIVLTAKK